MPALKTLICDGPVNDNEEEGIENLKQQLRHTSINDKFEEDNLYFIASPFKRVNGTLTKTRMVGVMTNSTDLQVARPRPRANIDTIDKEWIWEIRANLQDLFAKADSDDSDDSNDSDDNNVSDDSNDE